MKEESYNNEGIIQGFPEAKIALCKCKEGRKPYGIRMEKRGDKWIYTWAFPIKKEDSAKREGYDETIIKGLIDLDPEYPGCPYCGAKYYVVCGNCHKLNCLVQDSGTFKCEWCGNEGFLSDYDGAGISSGGDR